MNKSCNTKNKFLNNIALGSLLLGSFAGMFPQLYAGRAAPRKLVMGKPPAGNSPTAKSNAAKPPMGKAAAAKSALGNPNAAQSRVRSRGPAVSAKPNARASATPENFDGNAFFTAEQMTKLTQPDNPIDPKQYPLHCAVFFGFKDAVQRILAHGYDGNGWNSNEKYHNAVSPLELTLDPDIIALLCKKKANVNAQDVFGNTPLHQILGNPETIESHYPAISVLVEYGAQFDIKNQYGQTPQAIVETAIQNKIVKFNSTKKTIDDAVSQKYEIIYLLILLKLHNFPYPYRPSNALH
jgi:hypothetical protein